VVALFAVLALWRRRRGRTGRVALATSVLDGLTLLAIAGPLALTLVPSGRGPGGRTLDWIPLLSVWDQLTNPTDAHAAAIQLAGNLFVLMPFAMLLPIRWPVLDRAWRIVGATVLFGLLIEGLQFGVGLGRQASLSDVTLYAVGGLAGYAISSVARSRFALSEG